MSSKENINLIPALKLKGENTVSDALKIIEDKAWMLIVIVDEMGKLKGAVSTGDLRKVILNGQSVNTPLKSIMNAEPVCISIDHLNDPKDINNVLKTLRKLYSQQVVLFALIPVISKDREVLGVISLESLTNYEETNKLKAYQKTVLIVGGAGYIGSVLTRILLNNGWNVKVLDKLLYSDDSLNGLDKKRFRLIRGDANSIDTLVKAVEDVDAVVYLAELVGDPACSAAPQTTLKTNYLAVTSIAHLCSHLNINRFVYTSSCSVYGASSNPNDILNEESPLEPLSLYARIKALVEQAILLVSNMPNPMFAPTVLRLGTVFGYSHRPRFDLVVNTFTKNAFQKGSIEVFGGDQWRPNVHVSDVGQAILKVLEAPLKDVRAQIFNVGCNEYNYTIAGLADQVKKVFPDLNIIKKDNAVDMRNYRVDFSKIEKVLGFKSQMSVQDGIREIKEALEKNELVDWDNSKYSNIKRLKELNLV